MTLSVKDEQKSACERSKGQEERKRAAQKTGVEHERKLLSQIDQRSSLQLVKRKKDGEKRAVVKPENELKTKIDLWF